ncbi:hypothetical protein HMPREF1549_01773 [Actinomyces johnsonii F0510]|uniref:Uncharacterized protein n=1 Tax=Actinomyces johnsonii F0510 TaxID=1227262 RepID=U1RIU4_9ACTO|nr:hypothetical protein HMPREF1549_01773 [Actinomyces johnsonii F0510]
MDELTTGSLCGSQPDHIFARVVLPINAHEPPSAPSWARHRP